MKKNVVVIYDSLPEFRVFFEKIGIKIYPTFRSVGKSGIQQIFFTLVKRICLRSKYLSRFWYAGWVNHIENCDTIICFMSKHRYHIHYLKSKYPSKRIILWYWNPVFRVANPSYFINKGYELWSFDKADCSQYHMKFNSTFYFRDLKLTCKAKKFDVVFLGYSKGRDDQLKRIENEFIQLGLSTYFHVVPSSRQVNSPVKRMAYCDYLHLLGETNAILDLVQDGQQGLTLRPMEAIFFRKKLITNSLSIVSERFYNSENIFILGKDDWTTITSFLATPYKDIPNEYVEYYEMEQWLSRFCLENHTVT